MFIQSIYYGACRPLSSQKINLTKPASNKQLVLNEIKSLTIIAIKDIGRVKRANSLNLAAVGGLTA